METMTKPIRIDKETHVKLKIVAAKRGVTMIKIVQELVEDAYVISEQKTIEEYADCGYPV